MSCDSQADLHIAEYIDRRYLSVMFDRESTAEQIARSSDLRGRNAVLTGASSGIGAETARALALAGADLILGVRDVAAGEVVAREIAAAAKSDVRVLPLDLSDLHAVAAFADQVTGPVDLLIANAGVSKTPQTHLPNGLELRFATNHLGHFLLALRLRRQMAERGARLLVLSSAAHKGLPVHLDDLQWRKRPHSLAAYGESKSANILFAQEATRRWSTHGIYANAILPGSALTGLQRHHGDEMKRRIGFILPDGTVNPAVKSIAQAAATTLWAASSPELEQRGGLVLEDCGEALPVGPLTHPWSGFDARVADRETARLLWEHSLGLLSELCGGAIIPEGA
jgi:NAD(P)-dependent dehydrogenase (short-subunit alcohol dehydrogenase family)